MKQTQRAGILIGVELTRNDEDNYSLLLNYLEGGKSAASVLGYIEDGIFHQLCLLVSENQVESLIKSFSIKE